MDPRPAQPHGLHLVGLGGFCRADAAEHGRWYRQNFNVVRVESRGGIQRPTGGTQGRSHRRRARRPGIQLHCTQARLHRHVVSRPRSRHGHESCRASHASKRWHFANREAAGHGGRLRVLGMCEGERNGKGGQDEVMFVFDLVLHIRRLAMRRVEKTRPC